MLDEVPTDLATFDKRIAETNRAFQALRDQLARYIPNSPYKDDRLDELIMRAERYGAPDTAREMEAHPQRFGLPRATKATPELVDLLTNMALQSTELDFLNSHRRQLAMQRAPDTPYVLTLQGRDLVISADGKRAHWADEPGKLVDLKLEPVDPASDKERHLGPTERGRRKKRDREL